MNFVADESVDAEIVYTLRNNGHRVDYIAEFSPSLSDSEVLALAHKQESILLTCDKDFGELVVRNRQAHHGIILIRLHGLSQTQKGVLTLSVVKTQGENLQKKFSVISEQSVRIRSLL